VLKVYPFPSGSEVTSSYAVRASFANEVRFVQSSLTASSAGAVLQLVKGPPADINLCYITYEDYLQILSGSVVENCSENI
jgi:hypothetical protein